MKLPADVRTKVIQYLNYTYLPQEHQEELQAFFNHISPSLREEVQRFIFKSALTKNIIFSMNQNVKQFLIAKLTLDNSEPEKIKC